MKKLFFAVLATALLFLPSDRAMGDLMVIGANSDESEHFAFVVTSNYSAGTVLNFTDSSYGNSAAGEGDKFRWTEHFNQAAPTGPLTLTLTTSLSVGQVVVYDDVDNRFERPDGSAFGTTTGGEMDLGTAGENLFAYQGVVTQDAGVSAYRGNTSGVTSFDGAFLWGQSRSTWQTTGAGATADSYLPTAPNTPVNFVANTALDNIRYNGLRTFNSQTDMINALTNFANWTGSDTIVSTVGDFGGDFSIVPEPTALLMVGVAVAGCVVRRRRNG